VIDGFLQILRAFPTMLRVGFADILAYQAEMVIWVLSATMPLVMLVLWDAAAADGPVGGYGQVEFARYFTVNLVVRHLTSVWLVWELNNLIRQGTLSGWLLRPVAPMWWNLAETLAAWPLRMLVLSPVLVILVAWRPELLFVPTLENFLYGMLSTFLGLLLVFEVQCIFGMLAFWLDQTLGLYQAWFMVWGVLSGYLVPAALLPKAIQDISIYLPFRSTLGAPIEVLLGSTAPGPVLLTQVGWLIILGVGAAGLWKVGLRRYGAFGA
jgi:ABC-2 type transport system permease protein